MSIHIHIRRIMKVKIRIRQMRILTSFVTKLQIYSINANWQD